MQQKEATFAKGLHPPNFNTLPAYFLARPGQNLPRNLDLAVWKQTLPRSETWPIRKIPADAPFCIAWIDASTFCSFPLYRTNSCLSADRKLLRRARRPHSLKAGKSSNPANPSKVPPCEIFLTSQRQRGWFHTSTSTPQGPSPQLTKILVVWKLSRHLQVHDKLAQIELLWDTGTIAIPREQIEPERKGRWYHAR